MQPELSRLAEMYMGDQKKRDDVIIAKADGSTYYSISSRYGISSYPTIVLFKKGQVFPERYHEARNADSFSEFIERVAGPEEKAAATPQKVSGGANREANSPVITGDNADDVIRKLDYLIEHVNGKTNTNDKTDVANTLRELSDKIDKKLKVSTEDINFSHGISFLLLGVFLGVGISFTVINYRKLGKVKRLAD